LLVTPILVPGFVSMPVYFSGTLVIMASLLIVLTIQVYGKSKINPDANIQGVSLM
jgi:hypothetical protein